MNNMNNELLKIINEKLDIIFQNECLTSVPIVDKKIIEEYFKLEQRVLELELYSIKEDRK